MKAFELPVKLSEEGRVELPSELVDLIRSSNARILLLIDSDEEDWVGLSQAQFAAGYDDIDSIYDAFE